MIANALLHVGCETAPGRDGALGVVQVPGEYLQAVLAVERACHVIELVQIQRSILSRHSAHAVVQRARAAQVAQLDGTTVGQAVAGREICCAVGHNGATCVFDLAGGNDARGQHLRNGDHTRACAAATGRAWATR